MLAHRKQICYNFTGLAEARTANTYADDGAGAGNGASGEEAYGRI